jgi:hypothetical protein
MEKEIEQVKNEFDTNCCKDFFLFMKSLKP